jgi:hypothetical protein
MQPVSQQTISRGDGRGTYKPAESLRYKKRVKEAECSGNITLLYENGKMRQVETIVGMKGGRNEGKNDGRGWIQP